MMMIMKRNVGKLMIPLLVVLGSLVVSCNENDGPGLSEVAVEMKAVTNQSSLNPGGRTVNTDLEFVEVLLGVTEIEFEFEFGDTESEEDDEYEVEFEGNFIVDLIAGTSTPDFGITSLEPGLYHELEFKLEPILEDGNTVFIAFNYTPAGETEPIRYEYSNNYNEFEVEIENEKGFELEGNALSNVLVLLDLDVLFSGVDLGTAVADNDGVVRINESSNSELKFAIEGNFLEALDAGEDNDDDDDFDDDDDDD